MDLAHLSIIGEKVACMEGDTYSARENLLNHDDAPPYRLQCVYQQIEWWW